MAKTNQPSVNPGRFRPFQEEGDVQDGAITATNFDGFTPARMPDAPDIVVELIEANHYPAGAGEPSTTVVSPAIANAIQIAFGARVRSLPITAERSRRRWTPGSPTEHVTKRSVSENRAFFQFILRVIKDLTLY
jgi:hypothetical protein